MPTIFISTSCIPAMRLYPKNRTHFAAFYYSFAFRTQVAGTDRMYITARANGASSTSPN